VTFTPCFLWIFLGAPYVERLRENRALSAALAAITAAVVGVILNLALWFGLHVLFEDVRVFTGFGMHLDVPVLAHARSGRRGADAGGARRRVPAAPGAPHRARGERRCRDLPLSARPGERIENGGRFRDFDLA
jgi:hypothetical protein